MPIKESVIGGWQLKEADCPGEVETLFQQDLTVTGLVRARKRKFISNLTLFPADIFIDRKSDVIMFCRNIFSPGEIEVLILTPPTVRWLENLGGVTQSAKNLHF